MEETGLRWAKKNTTSELFSKSFHKSSVMDFGGKFLLSPN